MDQVKRRSTYYTEAKVKAARANVNRYDWAGAKRDEAVAYADQIVERGLDFVWALVPSQQLPRSYQTNQMLGNLSPLSDAAPSDNPLNKLGNYPWQADPLEAPWKLTEPTTGYSFPTNDFAAYYKSGLDDKGEFQPQLADRSLLVNTLYPERGEQWGVDDGLGWVDPVSGYTYTFIAYYTHWFVWFPAEGVVLRSLTSLRDAYLYTGDAKYVRAGMVLLDRIADIYPSLDVGQHDAKIYLNSHGGTGLGKSIGSIWETGTVKQLISAYDAFFPGMDDAEALQFLNEKSSRYGLSSKAAFTEIALNIENGILRQTYEGFRTAKIRGNSGFHQSALAYAAVVLDSDPETKEWLDYAFQAGGFMRNPDRLTGGNVWNTLVNEVDRDGHGNEAAPGYNWLWLNTYMMMADILEDYDRYPEADLFRHVKFRKMFQGAYPLTMLGRDTVQIGDTGKTGNPGTMPQLEQMVKAFQKYREPIFAQVAYLQNGNSVSGIHADIFEAEPEQIAADIEQVIKQYGELKLDSTNLTGYGFAALRDGGTDEASRRELWMYYGRNGGHGHRDTLNIGLYAYGMDLMPELGYPEQANSVDLHRKEWTINVTSHNTVIVDGQKPTIHVVGQPHHYDDAGRIKLIDVDAPLVYSQTDVYRRTAAMIQVDEAHSYVVDLFRVKGGLEHHLSYHGAEGTVTTEGLQLDEQPNGTYAGVDTEFGVRPTFGVPFNPAEEYEGAGFHWLRRVERQAKPSTPFSVEWNVVDTWNVRGQGAGAETDVRLRLTVLSPVDEVALADGVPPRNKIGNPASLRYMLAKRGSKDGTPLVSVFTSILEPHPSKRQVVSAVGVPVSKDGVLVQDWEAKAIKVQLTNGRTDYVISALDRNQEYVLEDRIAFRGSFGLLSIQHNEVEYRYVQDGDRIGWKDTTDNLGPSRIEGTVVDFTKELSTSNSLTVRMELAEVSFDRLKHAMIYVNHNHQRNAVYAIQGIESLENGLYRLDLGDVTLIHAFKNDQDPAEGYVYDLADGASFYIPLSFAASE